MGAQAVIIIEDRDMTELEGTIDDFVPETALYDGTGSTVYIPTILITQSDGKMIEDLFSSDPAVKMQVKVELESSMVHGEVTYELFYGSVLDLQESLLLDLYEYQHALGSNAVFIPRIQTFECQLCPEEIK